MIKNLLNFCINRKELCLRGVLHLLNFTSDANETLDIVYGDKVVKNWFLAFSHRRKQENEEKK